MDSLRLDLRNAIRNLRRRPGFSALAALTLAVGIGVNSVAFSAANALLFHPLVFKSVDRLGWVMLSAPGNPDGQMSLGEFDGLRRFAGVFDAVAAEGRQPLALLGDGGVLPLWALFVSADYFRALDARAESGRVLVAADATRTDLAAVVSHRFWERRMGGGPIARRTLTIANRSVSVVGVMPDSSRAEGAQAAPGRRARAISSRSRKSPARRSLSRIPGRAARAPRGAHGSDGGTARRVVAGTGVATCGLRSPGGRP